MRILVVVAILYPVALAVSFAENETLEEPQIVYPDRSSGVVSEGNAEEAPYSDLIADGESTIGMLVTVIGYLLIIGGMGVAGWYIFRRGLFRKSFSGKGGKLNIVESRMLGNRQCIMVVEYENNRLLLGVGPGKIDYLTSLDSYGAEFPKLEADEVKRSIKEAV